MAKWTFISSNVDAIEYRKELSILIIFFANGSAWEYSSVPNIVYLEFRDAPSPGKYYAAHVKGKYVGRKIDDPTED